MKLHWIYNNHINNFLCSRGVMPVVETDNRAGYRKTPQLAAVLESY